VFRFVSQVGGTYYERSSGSSASRNAARIGTFAAAWHFVIGMKSRMPWTKGRKR
jgi:hypothetical protein